MDKPRPTLRTLRKLMKRKNFQAYLDNAPQDDNAGVCGSAAKCAISQYVFKSCNMRGYLVSTCQDRVTIWKTTSNGKGYGKRVRQHAAEPWQEDFVNAFDRLNTEDATHSAAAEILRRIRTHR